MDIVVGRQFQGLRVATGAGKGSQGGSQVWYSGDWGAEWQ